MQRSSCFAVTAASVRVTIASFLTAACTTTVSAANILPDCEYEARGTTVPASSGTPVVISELTGTVISANFFNGSAIGGPSYDGQESVSVCISPVDASGDRVAEITSDIGLDDNFNIKGYPEFIVGSKFGNIYETSFRYYPMTGLPADQRWPVVAENLDQNGQPFEFANLEYVANVKGVGLPAYTNSLPNIVVKLDIDEYNVVGSERDVMLESWFFDTSANAAKIGQNQASDQPVANSLNNIVGVGHRHYPELNNTLLEMMVHLGALSPNDVSGASNNPGQHQLTENYSGMDFDEDGIDDHFDVDSHAYIDSVNTLDPDPGIYSSGIDVNGDGIDDADILPVIIGNHAYSIWYGESYLSPIVIFSRETDDTLSAQMDLSSEGEIELPWNEFLYYTLNQMEAQLQSAGVNWATGATNPFPAMRSAGGAIGGIEFGVEPQTNSPDDLPYSLIVNKFEVTIDGTQFGLVSNQAPAAIDDALVSTAGMAQVLELAANDSDADGVLDLASIQIVSPPSHGTLDINGDGTVLYTNDGTGASTDSFQYTVSDNNGKVSNAATVTITIDFPTFDPERLVAVNKVVAALESYGAFNGTYAINGGGHNGGGTGWFHLKNGARYPNSIADVLISEDHLNAPAPMDPEQVNPGSYDPFDFLIYRCRDRIGVFAITDHEATNASDQQWWITNGCNQYPIETQNHRYFVLSQKLDDVFSGDGKDPERVAAVNAVVTGLESYGAANGSYLVSGGGRDGSGSGWLHYKNGSTFATSIAEVLISGGHLSAPAPSDPKHIDTGIFSIHDFLVYRCRDRVGVFAITDAQTTDAEDQQWWSTNGCNQYPIATQNHSYFALSLPIDDVQIDDDDGERLAAMQAVVAGLESYGSENGSYLISGGGRDGGGSGWFHHENGTTYVQSIAEVLVSGGHVASPAPSDPVHMNTDVFSSHDFLVYRCRDRVGVFAIADNAVTSIEDQQWWTNSGCNQYPIVAQGHAYFVLARSIDKVFTGNDDERAAAVQIVVTGLESYGADNGSYQVSGGGRDGGGSGWFHYKNGTTFIESIADVLVTSGHLSSPVPADPRQTNPGSFSIYDFLIYRCRDRIGVFAISAEMATDAGDQQWWSSNGCNQYPIVTQNHTYFQLSQPLSDL